MKRPRGEERFGFLGTRNALPLRRSGRKSNRRYVMVMVVCPSCGGAKTGYRISCSDRGCRTGEITCDFCKGEGEVSSEASDCWHKGRAARDARVKERLSLFEKAAILGIAPEVLNDIEHGRRSSDELSNRSM
jgi:hypothetical protein